MVKRVAAMLEADFPCKICGDKLIYRANYQCVACSRRRAYERSDDESRKRNGLKPTAAGGARQARRALMETDRALREVARSTSATKYRSLRACKRGHREPERYTVTGGCVLCAAASSRRSYSRIRKA